MLEYDEVPLFGAAPGKITACAVESTIFDAVRRITISGRPANRKDYMSLTVRMSAEDSVHDVMGRFIPVMLRTTNIGANLWRRTLWALHNHLGREGYEVEIRHCGADPMRNRSRSG